MKPKHTPWTTLACFVALTFLLSNSIGCGGIILDRTTTIYGKVVDDYHQPVDSATIFILSRGLSKKAGITLKESYTDKDGNYRISFNVPRGYSSVDVGISYDKGSIPKYKDYIPSLNGVRVIDCCRVSVGKEVNYDFLLLSR